MSQSGVGTPLRPAPRCTHPWPLPHEGDLGPLTVEERGVGGGEVGVLKQDPLLQALLPQLLEALAGGVGASGIPGSGVLLGLRGPVERRHGCSPGSRLGPARGRKEREASARQDEATRDTGPTPWGSAALPGHHPAQQRWDTPRWQTPGRGALCPLGSRRHTAGVRLARPKQGQDPLSNGSLGREQEPTLGLEAAARTGLAQEEGVLSGRMALLPLAGGLGTACH